MNFLLTFLLQASLAEKSFKAERLDLGPLCTP